MSLRIAEIATLSRPVPPEGEGSVESIVSDLTEGLVARGHGVTLFATADSRTGGELRSPVEQSYVNDLDMWDWQVYEGFQVREAFRQCDDFDVIHCHSYHHALLFCDLVSVPVLMSLHLEPGPDYLFLAERSRNRHLHFCSRYQARHFEHIPEKTVIPHGVDVEAAREASNEVRGDDLVFLGRFHPDKGPLDAIQIARQMDRRLLLAAPANEYFRNHVEPEVDGEQIVYVGELQGAEKFRFLSRAAALLYPVNRGEPFGLVLIEALISGTPVLARSLGAVPEIVSHGVNGWLAESDSDFGRGVERLAEFDNNAIRKIALRDYSSERMVDGIEELLTRLVEKGVANA